MTRNETAGQFEVGHLTRLVRSDKDSVSMVQCKDTQLNPSVYFCFF
jgi:hypothetical protein